MSVICGITTYKILVLRRLISIVCGCVFYFITYWRVEWNEWSLCV